MDFTPSPLEQKWVKIGLQCEPCTVYGNLKSENSQDYAQKPRRNCTFMNKPSVQYVTVNRYGIYTVKKAVELLGVPSRNTFLM